ncbi:MAG: TetR/AcrR family transcriptional regulator [Pseudoxanthomonas sp.]
MAISNRGSAMRRSVMDGDPTQASPFDKESEHARKSHAILLTAARCFVETGFHTTSLQDIADKLGISKPTLCYYVGSKEEILFKCQHTGLERLRLTIIAARESELMGMEELSQIILHLAEWTGSEFARCLVRCQYDVREQVWQEKLVEERRLIDSIVQSVISRGISDGSIRPVSPVMATAAILGSLNWVATWYDPERSKRSPYDIGVDFLELFVKGLEPSAKAQPKQDKASKAKAVRNRVA